MALRPFCLDASFAPIVTRGAGLPLASDASAGFFVGPLHALLQVLGVDVCQSNVGIVALSSKENWKPTAWAYELESVVLANLA